MAWRDQMQKGSFRGVPFRAQSQDTEGGRRVAGHEYPGRDEPWQEDLGRKGRTHSLELHIIGADYMSGRDALQAALEKAGSAELVHPWLGKLSVQVSTYRLRESTREGGMATFSVTFLEAGKEQFPTSAIDTSAGVATSAAASRTTSITAFADRFSVAGQPAFVGEGAVAVLQQATSRIQALISGAPTLPQGMTGTLSGLNSLNGSLNALILQPLSLGNALDGNIAGFGSLFTNPLPALNAYRSLSLFGDSLVPVPSVTPSRVQQGDNQAAIVDLTQQLSLASEASTMSTYTPASSSEALSMRDDLADRLDVSAANAGSDAEYLALTDLRASMVKDMTTRAANLPQLGSYTPQATAPALVVAHRIYGDATMDQEIVARNKVANPGFVPGGSPLEVLRV